MSEKNNMTRNAMLFLPAKVIEGVLLMLCTSLYSYIFVKSAVGQFNTVNMTVNYAFLLFMAWMSNANTRYVAEESHKDKAQRLFSTTVSIYFLICAVMAVVCGILFAVTQNTQYLMGAAMFCAYAANTILNNTLVQLGRVAPAIVLSLGTASLKLLVAVLLVGGEMNYPSAQPAMIANVVADTFGAIGAVFALGIPKLYRPQLFSKELLRKLLDFGVPLMGVALCTGTLTLIDRFLVLGFFGDEVFAVYSSNNSLPASIFSMLSVAVLRGVYPAVLNAWRTDSQIKARALLNDGVRLYLLIALPAMFGLCAVATPLSTFFFAPGYEEGAPIIGYVAIAYVLMGLTEYANKGYELMQDTRPVLMNSAIAMVVKVVCSLACIQLFGYQGGAMGSTVAFGVYFLLTVITVKKRYFMWKIPTASCVRLFSAGALCGISAYAVTLLPISNMLALFGAVAVGGVVYIGTLAVTGEIREELRWVMAKIKRS